MENGLIQEGKITATCQSCKWFNKQNDSHGECHGIKFEYIDYHEQPKVGDIVISDLYDECLFLKLSVSKDFGCIRHTI